MDLAGTFTGSLNTLQQQLSALAKTTVLVLPIQTISSRRRATISRVSYFAVAPAFQNRSNDNITSEGANIALYLLYGQLDANHIDTAVAGNMTALHKKIHYVVLHHGTYASLMSTEAKSTSAATAFPAFIFYIIPIIVISLVLLIVVLGLRRRRQKERDARMKEILESRKSLGIDEHGFRVANPEDQHESKQRVYSGGEVDRDAGTAFMYVTVEDLKVVSAPFGRGMSTTSTHVIRDKKYWLNKAEPQEEEIYKHLPESWLASSNSFAPSDFNEDEMDANEFMNPLFNEGEDAQHGMSFANPAYEADGRATPMRDGRMSAALDGRQSVMGSDGRVLVPQNGRGTPLQDPGVQKRTGRRQHGPPPGSAYEEKVFSVNYSMYLYSS